MNQDLENTTTTTIDNTELGIEPGDTDDTAGISMLEPTTCSRFEKCFAPICPFDADWTARTHLKGDRACFYLRMYSKPAARGPLEGALPKKMREAVRVVHDSFISRKGALGNALREAATSPPKVQPFKTQPSDAQPSKVQPSESQPSTPMPAPVELTTGNTLPAPSHRQSEGYAVEGVGLIPMHPSPHGETIGTVR